MKLFKISFSSIISTLIFQSQLYGINLSCDFKQRINENELNGVKCGLVFNPICEIKKSDELQGWISEVIIMAEDIEVVTEPPDFLKPKSTQNNSEDIKKGVRLSQKLKIYFIIPLNKKSWTLKKIVISLCFRVI